MFLNKLGQVVVCGPNVSYSLGVGIRNNMEGYEIVPNLPQIRAISHVKYNGDNAISALIDVDNNLWVCGNNMLGNLGVGRKGDFVAEFTKVLDNVKDVIITRNIYALTLDNKLMSCCHSFNFQITMENIVEIKLIHTFPLFLDNCGNVYGFFNRPTNGSAIELIPELSGISVLSQLIKK